MSLVVRAATELDIKEITEIERQASTNGWSEEQFMQELESEHAYLLCCEHSNKLVGFCDMHIVFDDAHINEICVLPSERRFGAGFALMERAVELCKERSCAVASLEVRSKNLPAIKLYEKCGFSSVGVRKGFYHDPHDDALNMLMYFIAEKQK